MSHRPVECDHVLSAWTTESRTNEAGERLFVFRQVCLRPGCAFVDERTAAITEPSEMHYARTLEAGMEPDD